MKTKRNFSLGIKIASILSAVAILSVGFASWLIVSNPVPATHNTGSFQIETVEMRTATIAVNEEKTKDTLIVFGAAKGTIAENDTGWLRAPKDDNGNIIEENLTATIVFDVTAEGKNASGENITIADAIDTITIKLGDESGMLPGAYNAKVTVGGEEKSVLAAPVVKYQIGGGVEQTATLENGAFTIENFDTVSTESVEITVKLTFDWGEATDGQNPLTYYNNITNPTEAQATEAYDVLNSIRALNGLTYKLTVSGTVLDT